MQAAKDGSVKVTVTQGLQDTTNAMGSIKYFQLKVCVRARVCVCVCLCVCVCVCVCACVPARTALGSCPPPLFAQR